MGSGSRGASQKSSCTRDGRDKVMTATHNGSMIDHLAWGQKIKTAVKAMGNQELGWAAGVKDRRHERCCARSRLRFSRVGARRGGSRWAAVGVEGQERRLGSGGAAMVVVQETAQPFAAFVTGISQTHAGVSLNNLSYTYDPLARVSAFASIDGTASYGYFNDAPNIGDPSGLKIIVVSHVVQRPFRHEHLSIYIIPDNQGGWEYLTGRFKYGHRAGICPGKLAVVISAGPSGVPGFWGNVVSDDNRDTDYGPNNWHATNWRRSIIAPPPGMTEDQFITLLLQLHDGFADNKIDYDLFPKSGTEGYNSNSYIAGLLGASGCSLPKLSAERFPGWDKPIPGRHYYDQPHAPHGPSHPPRPRRAPNQ